MRSFLKLERQMSFDARLVLKQITQILSEKSVFVSDINSLCDLMQMPRNKLSRHLRHLRDVGIISLDYNDDVIEIKFRCE